jgi:hypothetical protein
MNVTLTLSVLALVLFVVICFLIFRYNRKNHSPKVQVRYMRASIFGSEIFDIKAERLYRVTIDSEGCQHFRDDEDVLQSTRLDIFEEWV